jgi:hypothetical protein
MAPLLLPAILKQLSERGSAAMKNDIVTYRTQYIKGKGKKKRAIDREIHVNPTSIAIAGGAAAVGLTAAAALAAIALFAGGMQASRETGTSRVYVLKMGANDPKNENRPTWTIYNARGLPVGRLKEWDGRGSAILSKAQLSQGWAAEDSVLVENTDGKIYTVKIRNDQKKHFALGSRPRFSITSKLF